MLSNSPAEITLLLQQSRKGDDDALKELTPIIYDALHSLAQRYVRRERANHTLQPTDIVHEVWMRLFKSKIPLETTDQGEWKNRAHFLAIASRQIREILVDHARSKNAQKRGGEWQRVDLEDLKLALPQKPFDLLMLDEALTQLGAELPQLSRIVELRYFGGLTEKETAEVLGISVSTLKREWKFAQAWLLKKLQS